MSALTVKRNKRWLSLPPDLRRRLTHIAKRNAYNRTQFEIWWFKKSGLVKSCDPFSRHRDGYQLEGGEVVGLYEGETDSMLHDITEDLLFVMEKTQ